MEEAKRFTLDEMYEMDVDFGLAKTEIYGLWEDGMVEAGDTVKKLMELQVKIHDVLKNPSYTTSDDYFDIVWARMYEGAEGTHTMEMGYAYRRRLELLMETIDVDITMIAINSDFDLTFY